MHEILCVQDNSIRFYAAYVKLHVYTTEHVRVEGSYNAILPQVYRISYMTIYIHVYHRFVWEDTLCEQILRTNLAQ